MTEFFWRDGVRIDPETATGGAGFRFGGGVNWVGVEALVVMRIAITEHLEVDVGRAEPYRAEDASVLVFGFPFYGNVLAGNVVGKPFFRLLAERLVRFGRVDSVKADFELGNGRDVRCPSGRGKDGDRIAIRDTNNTTMQLLGAGRKAQATAPQKQKKALFQKVEVLEQALFHPHLTSLSKVYHFI